MTIQVKDLTITNLRDFVPLMQALNEEMKEPKPLNLNWELGKSLMEQKMYVAFGAFDDYKPIGFVSGYVGIREFNDTKFLVHSAIYVLPEYRNGNVGARLIKSFENYARSIGAEYVSWSAHTDSYFEWLLQKSKSYKKVASIFHKSLGD